MRVTGTVSIEEDRSASVTIEVFPDVEALDRIGNEEGLSRLIEAFDSGTDALDVEPADDGRDPGVRVRFDVDDAAELAAPVQIPGTGGGTRTVVVFSRFDVVDGRDGWRLDAVLQPVEDIIQSIIGGAPDMTGAEGTLSIEMPGRISYTNADERKGSTSTWDLDQAVTQSLPLTVRTETGFYLNPVLVIIVGAVVLVLVGGFLIVAAEQTRVRGRLRRANRGLREDGWGAHRGDRDRVAPPLSGAAPTATSTGLYSDVTGDDSVALPVGGASWGPAPPPSPTASAPTEQPAPPAVASPSAIHEPPPTAPASFAPTPPPVPEPSTAPDRPPVAPPTPPGWYPDPGNPGVSRFWDGDRWTEHTT